MRAPLLLVLLGTVASLQPALYQPLQSEAPQASLFDCSSATTCDACYQTSYLCHWCAGNSSESQSNLPGSCHLKLSPSGCQVGASCSGDDCSLRHTCSSCGMGGCKWCGSSSCVALYSWQCAVPQQCYPNAQCIRAAPEFIGYIGAPSGLVTGVSVALLVLFSVAFCNILVCWRVKRLVGDIVRPPQPLLRESPNESAGIVLASVIDPVISALFACTTWLWGILALIMVSLSLLTMLWWPHPPEVNVCNAQVMWNETLSMIIRSAVLKTNVDLEMLVSVYNPNRLNIRIKSVDGDVFYRGNIPVARFELNSLHAQGGYVTDKLGTLTFNGLDQAAAMLYDFNWKHKLELTAKVSTAFEVLVGNSVLFALSATLPEFPINANEPPQQTRCHCNQNKLEDEDDGFLLDT